MKDEEVPKEILRKVAKLLMSEGTVHGLALGLVRTAADKEGQPIKPDPLIYFFAGHPILVKGMAGDLVGAAGAYAAFRASMHGDPSAPPLTQGDGWEVPDFMPKEWFDDEEDEGDEAT